MRIALFGATGRTGSRVLAKALDAGHEVKVLVRDPAKLGDQAARVEVITGDVLDPAAVQETVRGTEAVLSLIGHTKGSPKNLQGDATFNITQAMIESGVSRLVTLSGGGLRWHLDRPKLPDRIMRGLLKLLAKPVLADAETHLAVLRDSNVDWTVVRAPMLTDHPGKGRYRVGWVGADSGMRISRDDLADFILSQLTDDRFVHQLPYVSD